MSTPVSLFDYDLPVDSIAQIPAIPRESARLLVYSKSTGKIRHAHVSDLPSFFKSGDCIVLNNTKVFKARLFGTIDVPSPQNKHVELFLVRPVDKDTWLVLGKPGKKLKKGVCVRISDTFQARIRESHPDGTAYATFDMGRDDVITLANRYGHVPVPPYIKSEPDEKLYQTSYAKIVGSVAAPTAGFHLTANIRKQLTRLGVHIVEITLHVGLGTFLPIKTQNIDGHTLHSEWVSISNGAADEIHKAKHENRRVIAIGTTSVRTLEGVALQNYGRVKVFDGYINTYITPGFTFRVIDGMLTNFHLPKSSLIVLVSAYVGRENVLRAYGEAIKKRYRFYSFGDAMLIL